MKGETVQGIILQVIPYEENHRIVTLFTYEAGLVKVFAKKGARLAFLKSLNKVELLIAKGKRDLDQLIEGKFLKSFAEGKTEVLMTAGEMARSLLKQETRREAPPLYLLFEAFLLALPHIKNPKTLLLSFHLKYFLYEGSFSLADCCAACTQKMEEVHYFSAEPYCSQHADPNALLFSKEEFKMVQQLGFSRSISELDALEPSSQLVLKIQSLAKGGT